ncbi:MAG: division/cell wall cluster transcriptional repressor MraZ [Myxococcales bacterium]|nr:division/cell wall cluster transcriptional repressor MraZ [Myxococcales bacterium]
MKFRGEFEHSLDQKGRTAMPAPLRDVLDARSSENPPRIMLLRWLDPCLRLYVAEEWEAEEERVEASHDDLLDLDETYATLRRVIFSSATEVSFDKHNRILIRNSLRDHAGLDGSVMWVGQGRYVELWDPATWRASIETALHDRDKLRKGLREMTRRRPEGQ